MYETSITTADGQKLEAKTETVAEALSQFRPEFIKGKIVIDVSKGEKKYNTVVFVPAARRMFYNPFALNTFARNVERTLV